MLVHEIVLLCLVTAGAFADVRSGKIPNALTYPACVFGLALGLAQGGWGGLGGSAAGLALAFVPFFLLYLGGGLGGGDVKLMAAVGALMGVDFTLTALINAVLCGGLIALLIVIWEGKLLDALRFVGATLARPFRPGAPRPALEPQTELPFGVAICLACLLTLVASWQGEISPWHVLTGPLVAGALR